MGRQCLKLLLMPGNLVSSAAGFDDADGERMVRLLVNMLFWNVSLLLIAVAFL